MATRTIRMACPFVSCSFVGTPRAAKSEERLFCPECERESNAWEWSEEEDATIATYDKILRGEGPAEAGMLRDGGRDVIMATLRAMRAHVDRILTREGDNPCASR